MKEIMIAAPKSGSGKTIFTCTLLTLLKRKGYRPLAFKCGPDYIDPMFHRQVLGIPSGNLDTWFTEDPALTRQIYEGELADGQADFALIEGVMGYYDGAGMQTRASSYELACVLGVPALLLVDVKGFGNSLAAYIQGYINYRRPSRLVGIVLNRVSGPGLYQSYKKLIEAELGLPVLGYLPVLPQADLASRHLGLLRPWEIQNLQNRLEGLADRSEETLDLDRLLEVAGNRLLSGQEFPEKLLKKSQKNDNQLKNMLFGQEFQRRPFKDKAKRVRLAYAYDEAFCFYYQENRKLLESLGADLVAFSPLHDARMPEDICGVLFGGGYPELYLRELSGNRSMLMDLRKRLGQGLPYLAECGGFLYLQETLEGVPMFHQVSTIADILQGSIFVQR